MKVLGMGNALVDVLALIDDDNLLIDLGLPKGSMQLIDEKRKEELSKIIDEGEKFIASGGSASNTIIGLSKLGVETGFIGRVGKDTFGAYYKEDLDKYGVRSHLTIVDNETSGVATTFISKDGQRTFGTYLGAAAALTASDLKSEDFVGYDYFYVEGYLVQNLELIRTAVALAKKNGLKVILDMASYNIVEDNRDFLLEMMPEYIDIVFANEEEAKALFDSNPEETLVKLADMVDLAVVKVGKKGSWVQNGRDKKFISALKVDCVDTTGAGDLYASGFLYGLIQNRPLEVCGEWGTLLAGEVIQTIGPKIADDKWSKLINTL